jgi:hypothetical protein
MQITITWKAFENFTIPATQHRQSVTSATIELNGMFVDESREKDLCDILYQETNLWQGSLWNKLQPVLPALRTHTSLSIGDEVAITNGDVTRTYRCVDIGWELLTKVSN